MSEYCIELKNVTKKFGKFTAVDDVSIRLEPGKVYGFVGPNGAGKSTTMAIIMGALFPTKGTGRGSKIFPVQFREKQNRICFRGVDFRNTGGDISMGNRP